MKRATRIVIVDDGHALRALSRLLLGSEDSVVAEPFELRQLPRTVEQAADSPPAAS